MFDCPDILISLAPAYTKAILDGTKTVELRRRRVNVEIGARVWLYSKSPVARVEGTARVQRVHVGELKGLWSEYANEVGISRAEFDEYYKGCDKGCAIVLTGARAIVSPPDLKTMRKKLLGFHPPQFFKRLEIEEVNVLQGVSQIASVERCKSRARPTRLPRRRSISISLTA